MLGLCRQLSLALALSLPAISATEEEPPALSRYQRLVIALQGADEDWRSAYADAALSHLAEIYLAEADLARSQAQIEEHTPDAKLLGWSRAVEQYAEKLLLVQEDVGLGFPVEVYAETFGPPRLVTGGRSVILNHPREDQQSAYEQVVLSEVCRRRDCASLVPAEPVLEPIPMSAPSVTPEWRFGANGPSCYANSIFIQFSVAADLARVKPLCRQLLQELAALRNDIRWQQRHGVSVDWQSLAIKPTPQRPEHLVTLNGLGDTTLLSLPVLYGSPELLVLVTPWLASPVGGDTDEEIRLSAEDFGWR